MNMSGSAKNRERSRVNSQAQARVCFPEGGVAVPGLGQMVLAWNTAEWWRRKSWIVSLKVITS